MAGIVKFAHSPFGSPSALLSARPERGFPLSAATIVTPTAPPVPTGHPNGFWFFFWGEFAERCSYYVKRAILAKYMTSSLGVDEGDAGAYMSLFIGACYLFPLVGGYLADNYLGKYWTIVGFSLPYVFAQFLVGFDNPYVVFFSLTLLAMGSGVIKPNISTLMGLTYDQQRPGQTQLRTSAFSWFYMAINIGAVLSQFAMPWLRTKYGYQVAFLFPAGLMTIALIIFALGKKFYGKETFAPAILDPVAKAAERALKFATLKNIGSLFLLVMFFWAIFDQSASTWIFFADTYMDNTLFGVRDDGTTLLLSPEATESVTGAGASVINAVTGLFGGKPVGPTKTFAMNADAIQGFNPLFIIIFVPISVWLFKRMARRGREVKATRKLLIGFLLTASTMFIMAFAGMQGGTKQSVIKVTASNGEFLFPVAGGALKDQQAQDGKVELKSGSSTLVVEGWEYDAKKKKATITKLQARLPDGKAITIAENGVDFAKSKIVSNGQLVVPGAVDWKFTPGEYAHGTGTITVQDGNAFDHKPGTTFVLKPADPAKDLAKTTVEALDWVAPTERVTVWWQVFAFLVITVAEILISVTGLELAFVSAPPTMKSFVTAMWLVTVFLANWLINLPITKYLWPVLEPSVYFAMLGGMMLIVTVILVPVSQRFDRMMAAGSKKA